MSNENPETPKEAPSVTGIDLAVLHALLANQPRPAPWADFLRTIDPEYRPPMCTQSYYRSFRATAEKLTALGVVSTYDLTPELIRRFIEDRPPGQSAWTLKAALVRVRTICNQAVRHRKLNVSPFAIVPINRIVRLGKPQGKRHLTRLEIARLLEVLRSDVEALSGWGQFKARRLYFVVCMGLYLGLRKNELLRLQLEDIDLVNRVVRVKAHNETGRLKTTGSEQAVPIAAALVPLIQEWLAHRMDHPRGMPIDLDSPWAVPTCNRKSCWTGGYPGSKPLDRLKAVARRAGIEYITLHMLRRSCATHLEALGVPRSMVSRIMRHSSEKTTEQFYLQRDEKAMVDAIEGFEL